VFKEALLSNLFLRSIHAGLYCSIYGHDPTSFPYKLYCLG